MPKDSTKILLPEKEMPRQWYNVLPDLPKPLNPPISPRTGKPATPEEMSMIFPVGLLMQEVSQDRFIDIPEEILNLYRMWRPSPLFRARRLEEKLKTPAKIYYKYEGVSPAGSHKLNTAVAQAYYNKKEGINKLATETGAGQWGSALSLACSFFDMKVHIYMVKVSYEQKPYRKFMMEPEQSDELRKGDTREESRQPGKPRNRDKRSRGRGRHEQGYKLLAGKRAEPCMPAPDRNRSRSQETA
jgi:tryptophan synthase beta chain